MVGRIPSDATMCYMTTISQREMRNDSASVLRRVQGGETLTVTNRGRPVARLTPIRGSVLDDLEADGLARPPQDGWDTFPAPTRIPQTSSADIIADTRGYDR